MHGRRIPQSSIIGMLRETGVRLAKGDKIGPVCGGSSMLGQSYYRCIESMAS
jgi:hypothetical protein